MVNRERILQAAAEVYAQHGFRGATTRRIAEAAGVNEITLFRQFGSKEALLDEVVRAHGGGGAAVPPLPDEPHDPEEELTTWCAAHLDLLRERRSFIRQAMSEMEERPQAGPCAARPNVSAAAELKRYMQRLYSDGFVPGRSDGADESRLAHAAAAMLMAALFGDAIGRDVMPDMYPSPAAGAAALYVRLFLRALGVPGAPGEPPLSATPTRGTRRTSASAAAPHSPSTPNIRQ